MKKVRFLALAAVAALLLIFPAIVMGQVPVPDHQTKLMVMLDGEKVPDDTDVTAMIDGEDVAMGMTMDGVAFLKIPGTGATTGKEITFMVGDMMAAETDTWEQGGHRDKNFEIALSTGPPTATPRPTSTPDIRGPKGAKGNMGEAGAAGAKGATGSKGSAGAKGADGAAGAAGAAGPAGPKGSTGAAGTAGSDGAAGAAGADGAAGEEGTKGDRGSAGIAGGGGGLGVIALILAIVALVGVAGVFFVSRSS